MLLNEEGKKEFLKSKFHRYFDITLHIENENNPYFEQFVNFTLHKKTILDYLEDNGIEVDSIFNEEYNNVIFTPQSNNDIYNYEFFENIFYIRLKPFSENIRMHIIPKKYNASDRILILKKNKNSYITDDPDLDSTYHLSTEYRRNTNGINLYYQQNSAKKSYGFYKFDISQVGRHINNLQINAGYSYNDSNPTNNFNHFIGIIDGKYNDVPTDFNSTLANKVDFQNNNNINDYIVQLPPNIIGIPPDVPSATYNSNGYSVNEQKPWLNVNGTPSINIVKPDSNTNGFIEGYQKNKVYHKTLKYFNDMLYIEQNGQYYMQEWDSDIEW